MIEPRRPTAHFAGLLLTAALASGALSAETVVFTGATIHTMGPQGVIANGTLVLENGKIRAVGTSVAVPASARVIDARGKVITPGLFDSYTHLGVSEVNAVQGTQDSATNEKSQSAAFSVADAINPRSILIPITRIEGVTRALVAPEAGNSLIAGQGAVIQLGGGADTLVRTPVAIFVHLGEEGAGLTGGARSSSLLRLREIFQDAQDYAVNKKAFEGGERRAYVLSRLDLEAFQPVLRQELPLVVRVNRASDIEAVLRLSKELGFKLILAGAIEGWEVADQIAAARVPVLINALDNIPNDFESLGATLENAARLQKAGVTVALMTGDAHNVRNLRQGAGNAVAYGMPWEAALAAMTSVPAKIWGIEGSYGTLEPGKDADVVLWDGDPLELTSYPTRVFIRGVDIPLRSRQTELRDRYQNPGEATPPAYREPKP